jgi:hypothetical protein
MDFKSVLGLEGIEFVNPLAVGKKKQKDDIHDSNVDWDHPTQGRT